MSTSALNQAVNKTSAQSNRPQEVSIMLPFDESISKPGSHDDKLTDSGCHVGIDTKEVETKIYV